MGRKKAKVCLQREKLTIKFIWNPPIPVMFDFAQDRNIQHRDNYLIIGGLKVFVDNHRDVKSFERVSDSNRAPTGKISHNTHAHDDTNTYGEEVYSAETSYFTMLQDDPIIQKYQDMLKGEDTSFIQKFTDIVVDHQRPIDEILGCDVADEPLESGKDPGTSFEDESFNLVTMALYQNRAQYGRHKREKKKKTKEKRLQRMLSRGFSLQYIDKMIHSFVLDGNDMYVLPQMSKQEAEQVRKLASLYKCKFSLQGTSGKGRKSKNMPVLVATNESAIPSGKLEEERIRMFALEAAALRKFENLQVHEGTKAREGNRASHAVKGKINFISDGHIHPSESIESEIEGNAQKKDNFLSRQEEKKQEQPRLESKPMAMMTKADAKALARKRKKDERRKESSNVSNQAPYASFEKHTTGIGSKLLSKWGFEKGVHTGLGKQNDGIAEPIKVCTRPKCLGLGA